MKRLAVITTHPIQYYAPLFQSLNRSLDLMVFYTWGEDSLNKHDPGFNKKIEWDIPLLTGYAYVYLDNKAAAPGSHHFWGIQNPDILGAISSFNPDALLVFGWAYQSHLKAITYFKGRIPVYFRGDSTLLDSQKGLKQLFRKWFLKWVYRHVTAAFFVGSENRRYFQIHGLNEKQLVFAPHAIDNRRFSINYSDKATELRSKLKVGESSILLLFAGKFEKKKDPHILIEAYQQLKRLDIHLLFVGNGELEAEMKKSCADSGLLSQSIRNKRQGKVHFLNFQNQSFMPVIYQACDLFCLPSRGPGETWGLAVNEAMASGKAILVSDKVGCAIDLVKRDINGQIFKSGEVESLISALDSMLEDRQRLIAMGEQSKKIIEDWSLDRAAAAISETINKHEGR